MGESENTGANGMTTDDTDMDKLKLYSFKECPSCIEAKIRLKDDIRDGKIDVIDVTDDDAMASFMEDNFGGVPVLAMEIEDHVCEIDINDGTVKECVINSIREQNIHPESDENT